jgi:multiple sugar transport system substrate-binding protein
MTGRGWLRATATAAAAALVISGCAGPTSGGGSEAASNPDDWGEAKGTVKFWDTNANPALSKKWEKLIGDFNAANPDIKVEYVGLPNSSYLQKVDNALASGEVPDVLLIGNDVAHLIAQNALVSLDDAYEKSGLTSKIDASMIANERRNSSDSKLYKAPLSALSDVIWYRTDWLKQKGLPEPKTYDDFFALTQKLTEKDKNRFGFAFRGGPGSMPPMFAMTYGQAGIGKFFTDDGKATFNDPEAVKALERYVGLYGTVSAPADLSNDYAKIVAAFDGGSAWATHHNLGSTQDHFKALGPANVAGVQPFPNADGVITATAPAISGLGILAKSQKKAAAWKFVEYMSTTANSEWCETVGQVPANTEAAKAPWVQQSQPLRAIVETSKNPKTQYLQLPTYLPDWSKILKTEMEADFQKVLQKQLTAQAFADKYAARFEQAKKEYDESLKPGK